MGNCNTCINSEAIELPYMLLKLLLIEVVRMSHVNGVMHRDLKPENFIFANKKENFVLQAIEFVLSRFSSNLYILETSVFPREHPCLKELREMTDKQPQSLMSTPADEGQLISMLIKLINAKNTLEIGVYTGYSLLSTALALPSDGKVMALDINREYYELGLPMIKKAGVAHKIDFREGHALHLLDQLLQDENNKGTFDFVFVDADKDNYLNYHKKVIDLVKVGGLIGYDNTLWSGSVALPPDAPMIEFIRNLRGHVIEVNKYLAQDVRVEICQLTVGDGITLCRRIT